MLTRVPVITMGRNMGEHEIVKFMNTTKSIGRWIYQRRDSHSMSMNVLYASVCVCGAESDFEFHTLQDEEDSAGECENNKINEWIWKVVVFLLSFRKIRALKKWARSNEKNKSIETNLDPPSLSSLFTFRICLHFVLHFFLSSRCLFIIIFIRFWLWIKPERSSDNPQRWVNRYGDSMWLVWSGKKIVWENRIGVLRARLLKLLHILCSAWPLFVPQMIRIGASPHQLNRIDGCMQWFN